MSATPGPWVQMEVDRNQVVILREADCQIIAWVNTHHSMVTGENAALIAGAPDLLTWARWAARHLAGTDVCNSSQYEQLCRAIEKAELQ